MATVTRYKATIVNFDKVTGWTDGPQNPTTITATQDGSAGTTISAAVQSAIANVASGESLCVIVSAETVET